MKEIHPLARLFPALPANEFAALKEDIQKHGVQLPVLVYEGKILDGQNRWRACEELGVSCPTAEWNGAEPWLAVQSRNLIRRHLSREQITAIGFKAAEMGIAPEIATRIEAAKAAAQQRKEKGVKTGGKTGGRGRRKAQAPRGAQAIREKAAAAIHAESTND